MSSKADTISITQFSQYIQNHSDDFKDCEIISITHCKNVLSPVLHEYLHILIRRKGTGAWRRLLVERQKTQDQVIIGIWPWVSPTSSFGNSSSGGGSKESSVPLPLLMRNVTFYHQPLELNSVVRVLISIHNQRPKYKFITANCFWYSDAEFRVLGSGGRYYKWIWLKLRGIPVVPIAVLREAMTNAANKFQREVLERTPISTFPIETPTSEPSAHDEEKEFIAMGSNAMMNVLMEALRDPQSDPIFDEDKMAKSITARKEDLDLFGNAVLAGNSPQIQEECLEAYNNAITTEDDINIITNESEGQFVEKIQSAVEEIARTVEAPSAEDEERYELALRVFVGGVLLELSHPESPA